jgi:hypothetical protein
LRIKEEETRLTLHEHDDEEEEEEEVVLLALYSFKMHKSVEKKERNSVYDNGTV